MRRRSSLFGPLVWWELVRLARKGHATRARVLVLYVLLLAVVGFGAVWSYTHLGNVTQLFRVSADSLSVGGGATFGDNLALVLLEAQLLLVAVVAPAYAASALSDEKDRQTLPLLLTTDLSDREIVWGKVLGRSLFMFAGVLAGVPVFVLMLLIGGVDFQFLASGYLLAIGTTFLCVAIGTSAACHAPDTRTALVRAYSLTAILVGGALIPPFVLFSPFAMLAFTRYDFTLHPEVVRIACGVGYPIAQVVVAWTLVVEATRGLRDAGATAGSLDRTVYPEPPRGRPAPIVLTATRYQPPQLPPLNETDPVLWKERHLGRSPLPILDTPVRWLGAMFALIAILLFITGGWLLVKRAFRAFDPIEAEKLERRGPEPLDTGGNLMTMAGVIAAGLYLIPLAVGVTGSIAGERQRATLDSLLATLLRRRIVLWSKIRAHSESGLVFGVGAITGVGCGFWADGGARLGIAAMTALAATFALVIALGAWLSVRCATPARAFRFCMPAVVVAMALPVLARNAIEWETIEPTVNALAWVTGISVLAAIVSYWRAAAELERCA